jgi:hypothetical protein
VTKIPLKIAGDVNPVQSWTFPNFVSPFIAGWTWK